MSASDDKILQSDLRLLLRQHFVVYFSLYTTFSHPKQKLTLKMGGLGSPLTQVYVPLVQPPEKLIAIFLILVLGL